MGSRLGVEQPHRCRRVTPLRRVSRLRTSLKPFFWLRMMNASYASSAMVMSFDASSTRACGYSTKLAVGPNHLDCRAHRAAPPSLLTLEKPMCRPGIEPGLLAWEANVLPLDHRHSPPSYPTPALERSVSPPMVGRWLPSESGRTSTDSPDAAPICPSRSIIE